ncbi:hypothetical protein V8C37DRAFT_389667 [Trichoderma ceciliae]
MDSRDSQPPAKSKEEASEKSYGRSAASSMDTGAGSCHMASTFYEIFRESGLQRQLENGWGRAYSYGNAADTASPPASDIDSSNQPNQSQSRQSLKASSSSSSRKHAQSRDGKSRRSPKSKKHRSGQVKKEDEEDDVDAAQAVQEPSNSYSLKRDSQSAGSGEDHRTSRYKLNGEDYGDREYLTGLNSELDTLRKHLLQRANPPRSFP